MLLDTHFLSFSYLINIFIHDMLFACLRGWQCHAQTHLSYCCVSLRIAATRLYFDSLKCICCSDNGKLLPSLECTSFCQLVFSVLKRKTTKNIITALFHSCLVLLHYERKWPRFLKCLCLFHYNTHNILRKSEKFYP